MKSFEQEAIGGINAFLEEQKKLPGEARISIVLFDNEYLLINDRTDIQQVKAFDSTTYQPRGTTALLDAVGRTIDDVGRKLEALPDVDKPERVIMAILTDGYENASHDYTKEKVRQMIEHQTKSYNWQFLFLAADDKAFADAVHQYGIDPRAAMLFDKSGAGVGRAYMHMSSATKSFRSGGGIKPH